MSIVRANNRKPYKVLEKEPKMVQNRTTISSFLLTMKSRYAQIKLNLPFQLKELLKEKASRFGFSVPTYIKTLIVSDIKEEEYPVYEASERVIKAAKEAMEDEKKGRLITLKTDKDIDEFFENLEKQE